MKTSEVKKGTKVILPSAYYSDSPHNPHWGGEHGHVVGVIDEIGSSAVGVQWENGCRNSYAYGELELLDCASGICEEIW